MAVEMQEQDLDDLFDRLSQARAEGRELPQEKPEQPEQAGQADDAQAKAEPPKSEPEKAQPDDKEQAQEQGKQKDQIDLDALPPDIRAYIDKLENERRAAVGRAAAAQREAASLRQRVQAVAQPPAKQETESAGASSQLAKEFPELAAALKEEISALTAQFAERFDRETTLIKAQALEAVFPGWVETMRSEQFHYWLSQQPEPVQKKFESDSLADYASLLRDFHAASAGQPVSEVSRIRAERDALLANSTAIQSAPSAPNPTGEPDAETDPDAYFNWLAKKREMELRRAGRL